MKYLSYISIEREIEDWETKIFELEDKIRILEDKYEQSNNFNVNQFGRIQKKLLVWKRKLDKLRRDVKAFK